jgi:DNA-binding PadR family transcriptional regulator
MGGLSELEACVLGLIWSEGPCTPYRVQKIVRQSPSPHWSGSAGAIYPIFKRLEEKGLLRSESRTQGRRASQVFRTSADGNRTLRAWLGPPLPEWTADLPIDPLRTRLRFLGALPPGKRTALLAQAGERLEEKLRWLRQDCRRLAKLDDPFPYAMARGAVHVTRARIQWLREVEHLVRRRR